MPVFVENHGELIPFANQQEADAYLASARQESVFDSAHTADPQRGGGAPSADPLAPQAPPAIGQNIDGYPDPQNTEAPGDNNAIGGKVRMRKNDEIWEFDEAQRQEALASGYQDATAADISAAQEREEAKNPFGDSFLGQVGNSAVAAGESALEATLAVPAAMISVATGENMSGGDIMSSMYSSIDGGTIEEQKKGIQLRREGRQIEAFVGEAVTYMTGAGAVAKGLAKVGMKVGMKATAANIAAQGVEGAVTAGLSANEGAWIRDEEFTAGDLFASMGAGALFGVALPAVSIGAKATTKKLKDVFGEAGNKAKKAREAALGGERASWMNDPQGKFLDITTEGEGARSGFRAVGVEPQDLLNSSPLPAEFAEKQIVDDFNAFSNIRLAEDGKAINRFGAGKQYDVNLRAAKRRTEIEGEYADILGDGQAPADTVYESLTRNLNAGKGQLLREVGEDVAAKIERDIVELYPEDLRKLVELEGKPTGVMKSDGTPYLHPAPDLGDFNIPVKKLQEQKRRLIKIAANAGGGEKPALAQLVDELEAVMSQHADDGVRFTKNLAEDKLLRRIGGSIKKNVTAGPADSPGYGAAAMGMLQGAALKATGIHALAGSGMIVKGNRAMMAQAKAQFAQQAIAKRYFKGTVAYKEMTNDAVQNLFQRGAAKVKDAAAKVGKWNVRKFDPSKRTGGYVTGDFYRGMMPPTVSRFMADGESNGEAFDRHMTELDQIGANFEQVQSAFAAHIGPEAESHPNLTMNATMAPVNALMYLQQARPKQGSQSMLTPNVKSYRPSPGEIATYARKWEAVMDPYTVVENFANGQLTKDGMEAIQRVYPGFATNLQEAVMDSLGDRTEALDYRTKAQVEILMGAPGVLIPANAPAFQQRLAQLAAVTQSAQAQGQPPPQATGGKKGDPSLAQQYQSPVNRAMMNINN